ncbi:MAG: 50S ribosomal protein L28 [Micavibrio aeruginosavorus]|uniref:Large ribosomal subunit protein bL28 n=1 Tax=Micavibrio aeruginosavorus TaxID=349221 RepID=A0A2W5FJ00_9BACT|nr:MAG: 50S ribosomal protein L28 [Micavibrio aeruginosavorus]
MSRKCQVTGKKVMFGNNVSHANNKTRRTFFPNVQDTRLFSDALGALVPLRISAAGMRTVEHKGGLDAFLTSTPKTKLDTDLHALKTRVEKAIAKKAAA